MRKKNKADEASEISKFAYLYLKRQVPIEELQQVMKEMKSRFLSMESERTNYRTESRLRKDGLLGRAPKGTKRYRAIVEVLCALPKRDYRKLLNQRFRFLLPDKSVYGFTTGFQQPCDVIFLSPQLECRPIEIVAYIVAHELAHLLKYHRHLPYSKEYLEQEADKVVCNEWGLKIEWEKYHLFHRLNSFRAVKANFLRSEKRKLTI